MFRHDCDVVVGREICCQRPFAFHETCSVNFRSVIEDVEDFIEQNRIDMGAARALRAELPEIQQGVVDRGTLDGFQNPSALVMARIRDVKAVREEAAARGKVSGQSTGSGGCAGQLTRHLAEQVKAWSITKEGQAKRSWRQHSQRPLEVFPRGCPRRAAFNGVFPESSEPSSDSNTLWECVVADLWPLLFLTVSS